RTLRFARSIAEGAGVSNDDDEVGSAPAELAREAVHHGRRVHGAEPDDIGWACRRHRLPRGDPDDADAQVAAPDERVVPNPADVPTARVAHVRSENRVACLTHARSERVLSPIEFVIAERRGGDAEPIEDV